MIPIGVFARYSVRMNSRNRLRRRIGRLLSDIRERAVIDPGVQTLHIVDLVIQGGLKKDVAVGCFALGGRGGVDLVAQPYFHAFNSVETAFQ